MFRELTVLAVMAFCLVGAEYYNVRTADQDYLGKQQKIYNLFYHPGQPSIVSPTLYQEGIAFNIEANIESYTNKQAVKDFLSLYAHGFLGRGEVFSPYYPKLVKEMKALFRLFYYAKDFDTFYKTATWARIHINEEQFLYALYNAVFLRPDTVYLQVPPPYEAYPYSFFNTEVLKKAQHPKIFGKLDTKKYGGHDTYIIPANYSGWYYNLEYEFEYKLNYFTEDVGLNSYYFFFRLTNAFWLKTEEFGLYKNRGAEYLYGHKLLYARYNLERLANDLGCVEDFDWHKKFYPGYYPSLSHHNGLQYAQRPYWSEFPYYKQKYISRIADIEPRISLLVDGGVVFSPEGKAVNVNTDEGLNILGNIIEGNADSYNYNLYGNYDAISRKILGCNPEPAQPYQIVPSALEFFSTSMRDPAFYRLYKKIFDFYCRYKENQKYYVKEDLVYTDIKIESLVTDKLVTFFEQFDSTVNNALVVNTEAEAKSYVVKARQYRINHNPYIYRISINSNQATKICIRIFLGPKYDACRKPISFNTNIQDFVEIDNFHVDVTPGMNKIERHSTDAFFTIVDPEPSEVYYNKIMKALAGADTLTYNGRLYGFPQRLLLPKGKKDGLPLQFFVYASPVTKLVPYSSRVFGEYNLDDKPFGFPLDKPVKNFYYDGPNMIFKDVLIYHKDDPIYYKDNATTTTSS